MATLSAWPWGNYGNLKYLLYAALAAQVVYSLAYQEDYSRAFWCLNILISCGLKGIVHVFWSSYNNMLFLTRTLRINPNGVDFKQIDHEWHWDNYILLQAVLATMICYMSPPLMMINSTIPLAIPLWNTKGLIMLLVLHVTFSEPLYYFLHRSVHRNNYLFTHYHSFHHSSPVPNPMTGVGSISLIYGYAIMFDFLRCLGQCNVEIFSHKLFESLPILRYLIYTPTYHGLHHEDMGTNFCLFMPIFDVLGNTLNPNSWELQKKIRLAAVIIDERVIARTIVRFNAIHDKALLAAAVASDVDGNVGHVGLVKDISFHLLHPQEQSLPDLGRSKSWLPRNASLFFLYFLPFAKQGINNHIEAAILRADKLGVKVISLAALNKNEALNGGGTLFVNKHPDLRVRVVHGNTLTAAVILNGVPKDVKEVFLTGATCHRSLPLSSGSESSPERFQNIQKEAPAEFQNYLVQVTKYNSAQHCKTWIVGKWLTPREQSWAPAGTHFHQFVVPPILKFRRNYTYDELAAVRLPKDVQGLGTCEYTMDRGVVHACHAGGLVHMLEGWEHHEVGAVDVERIDLVWEAAMRHGLSSLSSLTD
ncbi:hypothetical protein YC2023_027506 [Brassica napus]